MQKLVFGIALLAAASILAPSDAEAAKKKKNNPQVAGFVQTSSVKSGKNGIAGPIGTQKYGYLYTTVGKDPVKQFFQRIESKSGGG
jgi:hypothetical protein